MNNGVIACLFTAFNSLDTAIQQAERVLRERGALTDEARARLKTYREMVQKQREFAEQLRTHMEAGRLGEVGRCVDVINNLSGMLARDARELLASCTTRGDFNFKEESPYASC